MDRVGVCHHDGSDACMDLGWEVSCWIDDVTVDGARKFARQQAPSLQFQDVIGSNPNIYFLLVHVYFECSRSYGRFRSWPFH